MTAAMTDDYTRTHDGGDGLARALGWFSIGLGATQLIAPRQLARWIGIDDGGNTVTVMRMLGVREVASGLAILSQPDNPRWLAGRVAGDMMDLALLGRAMRQDDERDSRTTMAAAAVMGATLLDAFATRKVARENGGGGGEIRVHKTLTVRRSPEEAYGLWRDLEGLPRFMHHLESVTLLGEGRSRWRARGPAGRSFEWDAEITADRPNELIAWQSLPGSDVDNAGTVQFRPAPGDQGTEVHVMIRYAPPAGRAGAMIAKLFGREPSQEIDGDLRRFKQVLEIGEVTRSDASIHRGPHPARPSDEIPEEMLSEGLLTTGGARA